MEQEVQLQKMQPTEVSNFNSTYSNLIEFTQQKLKIDVDYGIIPGTQKKTLYKPGAEKIAFLFGLKPQLETIKEIEDFKEGFFYYKIKCKLIHFHTDKFAGEAIRSCNSMEKKYAYGTVGLRWATEDQKNNKVTIEKDSRGYDRLKYKKTPEEQADQANTILAMAQKRAIVAAVAQATMATEIFDVDDDTKDDTVYENSPNKIDNPERINLQGKLAMVAEERGFEFSEVHAAIKKKNKVDSFNDLTNKEIKDFIEVLETTYKAVGKNNKPEKIGLKKQEIQSIEPDKKYCRNTNTHGNKVEIPEDTTATTEWFCCIECEQEYFATRDEIDNAKSRFNEMLKQGKIKKASELKKDS